MGTISFNRLLLKTSFCCMASDGHIDEREISLIRTLCGESPYLKEFDFQEEINQLITKINTRGTEFIRYYFDLLDDTELTEEEELTIVDFAIRTINADEKVEYSEVKFFKNIRHRLKVSDEKILEHHPDIEMYLEEDIITDSFLDKITKQYLETADLPAFDLVNLDIPSSENDS